MKECGEILIIYCCQTVEEEDMMADFRKDLIVLLRSIVRVAPDVTQLFIKNSLDSAVASPPDRIVEEVEAALTLFYSLGESLTDEAIKTGKGLLGELVPMLLSTQFSCLSNRLVALVYLDTITRFMRFVQQNTQYIPMVLRAFLDERGIHHPNVNVSRRASYLFMRAVRLLKTQLVPYIETILQSLQDKVAHFTNMGPASDELLKADDGSHMFEAIGILIGMEDVPFEKQSEYLSALLTPLCQQVKMVISKAKVQNSEESSVEIDNIQHIIMAINSLSKGFSERLVIEKCMPLRTHSIFLLGCPLFFISSDEDLHSEMNLMNAKSLKSIIWKPVSFIAPGQKLVGKI